MSRQSAPAPVQDAMRETAARIIALMRERRYAPGERLPSERDLAERFGVSRTVLREALSVLEMTGMIERRPNSGLFIPASIEKSSFEATVLQSELGLPIERSVIEQSLEVRRILELEAVTLACERRGTADLARMEEILKETERRLSAGQNIVDLDENFHLAIAAATRNEIFAQIVHGFFRSSRRRREHYFASVERRQRSHEEHGRIVDAIRRADGAAAREAMKTHLGEVRKRSLFQN